MSNTLLPCPFCGGEAEIKWESWTEISETSGAYALHVHHRDRCFFKTMNGIYGTKFMTSFNKEAIIAAWNRRADARQHALKTKVCPMCEDWGI